MAKASSSKSRKSVSTRTKGGAGAASALLAAEFGELTIGALLRSIREGEEESLSAFASQLGVSKSNLSDIEHGHRGVSLRRAAEWAETLGYPVRQFVELALQQELRDANLDLRVTVQSAVA